MGTNQTSLFHELEVNFSKEKELILASFVKLRSLVRSLDKMNKELVESEESTNYMLRVFLVELIEKRAKESSDLILYLDLVIGDSGKQKFQNQIVEREPRSVDDLIPAISNERRHISNKLTQMIKDYDLSDFENEIINRVYKKLSL